MPLSNTTDGETFQFSVVWDAASAVTKIESIKAITATSTVCLIQKGMSSDFVLVGDTRIKLVKFEQYVLLSS